ncbi:hypothetical protein Cgig2_004588 [Carnegiea gigantea]|uniref:Uncharacterized protein n=1 Tax=Carnegiea gigantea TaxID=171969 RepID=A0A9Q1Q915_9CARY|nr:hypothetical protein Cgig2_004588 [Carnegiea gigantea]
MLEVGAIHEYTAEKMRSLLVGLRWSDFEVWMRIMDDVIRGAQLAGRSGGQGEPKKIPDVVPLFEPGTPSWSHCEYSSSPSVLSPEVEVTYPWEITIANYVPDFQVRRMVKTKSTPRIQSPDELLAEGTLGNLCSVPTQSDPETGDLGWYCFNNWPDFMTTIEKKSKLKYWKYDFLFLRQELGWDDVPKWNEGKPVRNPFGEPTTEERHTARYFMFYIREDDKPQPIPRFMTQAIESVKGPEKRRSKSSNREPLNWLPRSSENPTDGLSNWDATREQVVAAAERRREEERQLRIAQQAKKVWHPPLYLQEEARGEFAGPQEAKDRGSSWGDRGVRPFASGGSEGRSSDCSSIGEAVNRGAKPCLAGAPDSLPRREAATPSASGTSSLAPRPLTNFIKADASTRLSLVQDIVKSWDLAAPGASDPPKVSEEEMDMADVFAKGRRCERLQANLEGREGEKKELQCQLEKAAADAVEAKEQGYQQGRSDTRVYLYKVLLTLAGEWLCGRVRTEGRDPEEVEFIPPSYEGKAAEDEATNPLEVEAGASEEEGCEDRGEPDVNGEDEATNPLEAEAGASEEEGCEDDEEPDV